MRITHKKSSRFLGTITKHVRDNIKPYLFTACILLIGITLGVVFINNLNEQQFQEVQNYINDFISSIKSGSKIDTGNLLQSSIRNNIILVVIMWFAGSTVIRNSISAWDGTI